MMVEVIVNEDADNCWEFWDCPKDTKESCPAFVNNMGRECWVINKFKPTCPKAIKYGKCYRCEWFKKLNPDG